MSSSEDNIHEPLLGLGEEAIKEDIKKPRPKSCIARFEEKFVQIACPPGIDIGVFVCLQLLLLCEGVTMSSVYSYVSYMVVDLGAAADVDEAGTWAGVINSMYFVCQFVSSFVMGYIADRIGRKPAFIFGACGVFVSLICFGFSVNIWMAIAFRGINGLLNGNAAVGKAACGEITNETNRVKAFTYVGLMFGIGNIVGSTLGGFLARPDIDTFGGFFKKFPYALATIGVSPIVLATVLAIIFFYTEPPRDKIRKQRAAAAAAEKAAREKAAKEKAAKEHHKHAINGASGITYEDEDGEGVPIEVHYSTADKTKFFCSKVYRERYVILCIGQYFIISCAQIIANMMISTWTVAHVESGGLDFTPTDVGLATSIGGIAMLIMFAFFCTPIINKLKITGTMKLMSALLTLDFIGMPLANNVARIDPSKIAISNRALVWIYYGFLIALWQCTVQVMINCSSLSTNNSVPVEKLSIANSVSQAVGCVARAIGPITAGPLLAWSLKPEQKFPCNYFFCFIICAIASILYFALSFLIPKQINVPYNAKGGYGAYLKAKEEAEEARRMREAEDEGLREEDEGIVEKKGLLAKNPYDNEDEEEDGITYVNKEDDEI